MKNVKLMFLGLAVATLGMSACKKEVVGPTGPAGPAGNANVKSLTFTTTSTDWVGNGADGYAASFNAPIITSDIVATGAVMCYINWGGNTMALPYSYLYSGYTRHMLFNYSVGSLNVTIRDDDSATSNPGNSSAVVKIVAISSTGLIANPDLDLTNYEAVKEAFDLK